MRGKYVFLPFRKIKQDKHQDRFPRKKSVEAMRVGAYQRFPGNINKKCGNDSKNKQWDHLCSGAITCTCAFSWKRNIRGTVGVVNSRMLGLASNSFHHERGRTS